MNRLDTDRRDENTAISTQKGRGRKPYTQAEKVSKFTATREYSGAEVTEGLMEQIVSRGNMMAAHHRVVSNKGSAGIDEMSVDALMAYLKKDWAAIKDDLLNGRYQPMPVRKVEIPKPGGKGMRMLGIPTVLDRLIQQALHQILMPIFDPEFSGSSFGFRPGRSAQQAVLSAHGYVVSGRKWVVDMDLEKFFDRVNHDVLMARVGRKIRDKRVLCLIGKYLRAGLMSGGVVTARREGTPQGGDISPLLANLFLHYAFDTWMARNHRDIPFERYADDGICHCKSLSQAESLKASLQQRMADCGLELHPEKTKIVYCKDDDRRDNYRERSFDFLDYTFRARRSKNRWGKYFVNFTPAISNKAAKAMRQTMRRWALQNRSDKSLNDLAHMFNPVLRGWIGYYGHFYKSAMYPTLRHFDQILARWARRKYKRFSGHKRQAGRWVAAAAERQSGLFAHWKMLKGHG